MAIDEVSKEGKMVEYSKPPSQDTKVQVVGSTEIEITKGELSQQEKTLGRSDKGKEVVEHAPLSLRARSLAEHVPRWIQKIIMRSTKPQFCASEEDICDIVEILNKPESPSCKATPLVFVTTTQNQELFAQVVVPPKDIDVERLGPQDNELNEVMLGRPTQDSIGLIMTIGVKQVLKNMEQDEAKLQTL